MREQKRSHFSKVFDGTIALQRNGCLAFRFAFFHRNSSSSCLGFVNCAHPVDVVRPGIRLLTRIFIGVNFRDRLLTGLVTPQRITFKESVH